MKKRITAWFGSGESLWVGPPSADGKEYTKRDKLRKNVDRCSGCDLDDYIESCAYMVQETAHDLGFGKLTYVEAHNLVVVALCERVMASWQRSLLALPVESKATLTIIRTSGYSASKSVDHENISTNTQQRALNPHDKFKHHERYLAWQLGWNEGIDSQC